MFTPSKVSACIPKQNRTFRASSPENMRAHGWYISWMRGFSISPFGLLKAMTRIEQISLALTTRQDLPGQETSIYWQKC
ncbi:hypothetical protein D3C87_2110230 [compost metagenome]